MDSETGDLPGVVDVGDGCRVMLWDMDGDTHW